MYRSIYTVANEYINKKIYVYKVNRDSVSVFTDLAFRDADVSGFWDERFAGEKFMNRPILSCKQLMNEKDSIIILSKEVEKDIAAEIFDRERLYYVDEILGLNQELKHEKIYVYGIGKQGERIYQLLNEKGIGIEAGCVTQKKERIIWHGKEVLSIEEIGQDDQCAIIVATMTEEYKREMLKNIGKYTANKYVDMFLEPYIISEGTFFQVINRAVNEAKDIYLYGKKDDVMQMVERILQKYQVNIKGKIYETEKGNGDIYDLAYEGIENTVVVIADQDMEHVEYISEVLDSLGFALEKMQYTAVELNTKKVRERLHTKTDYLVGWSTDNDKYPGYVVYGEDKETDIKILVLGGSTSTDGIYRTVSWVREFYANLVKMGYAVTIYNGAACGHGVVEEFLRLCRDGEYLKPDYVISFGGVNNIVRKKVKNQFCEQWLINTYGTECISGIASEESLYDFWYRVIRLMSVVCEAYGGKFYSFLQPIYSPNRMKNIWEISMYEMMDRRDNVILFRERSKQEKNGIYTNLIDLFDEEENVYIDCVHYSSRMNKIIGKTIADIIIKAERGLKKIGRE